MTQNKKIRDLKRTDRESRTYREYIEREGITPHILCDSNGIYWDGGTVVAKNGKTSTAISGVHKRQLCKMILDGYYGEEIKDAIIDCDAYWKIRDALITWPDQERIAKEGLRALDVKLSTQ